MIDLRERLTVRTDVNGPIVRPGLGPCHLWQGGQSDNGYGLIWLGARADGVASTHRVAFFLAHGRWPIPCGLHHCDVRHCVKAVADEHGPAHIYEGTKRQNARDMADRGRAFAQAHPERLARGDAHWTRLRPDDRVRGERHGRAKLSQVSVDAIRVELATGAPKAAIARRHGVSRSAVSSIACGRAWGPHVDRS